MSVQIMQAESIINEFIDVFAEISKDMATQQDDFPEEAVTAVVTALHMTKAVYIAKLTIEELVPKDGPF